MGVEVVHGVEGKAGMLGCCAEGGEHSVPKAVLKVKFVTC